MKQDRYAPEGCVWICCVCAKISPYDRYGDDKSHYGWDVSCVMNSVIMKKEDAEAAREKYHSASNIGEDLED